jgi:hypothetical protein
MDFITTLALFILMLFLYIYIVNQYKKSEDLDIYEMDFSNNAYLQEVCDIRQPVIFHFQPIHPKLFSEMNPAHISKFHSYDVCVKDAHDYYKQKRAEHNHVDAVNLSFNSTIKLLENDKAQHFFSERNEEFLEESGLLKTLQTNDDFLKPSFTIVSHYDLMFGSPGAVTPLRYHTNFRQFLCVTSGHIRVKMSPWKSSKYLHPQKDYENYEFRSPVHPLHPKPEYAMDFEKTKFLEFDVKEGYMLFVPPYWYYSIQYSETPGTFVCEMAYNTIMNCVSNLPDLGLYWLQQQNITKKITKIQEIEPTQGKILENNESKTILEKEESEKIAHPISPSQNENQHFQDIVPKMIPEIPSSKPELLIETRQEELAKQYSPPVIPPSSETLEEIKEESKQTVNEELAKQIASETMDSVLNKLSGQGVEVHNI